MTITYASEPALSNNLGAGNHGVALLLQSVTLTIRHYDQIHNGPQTLVPSTLDPHPHSMPTYNASTRPCRRRLGILRACLSILKPTEPVAIEMAEHILQRSYAYVSILVTCFRSCSDCTWMASQYEPGDWIGYFWRARARSSRGRIWQGVAFRRNHAADCSPSRPTQQAVSIAPPVCVRRVSAASNGLGFDRPRPCCRLLHRHSPNESRVKIKFAKVRVLASRQTWYFPKYRHPGRENQQGVELW